METPEPLEKRKLLPVAETTTPAEAAAVSAALEKAGIPACIQDVPPHGYIGDMPTKGDMPGHRKRVFAPAERVLEAEEVINAFLDQVKKAAVRRAFRPEQVEDQAKDPRPEPEMADALATLELHAEARDERLSELVADWLTAGDSEVSIAQRLAAAELSEAEATDLVARVVSERADLFERSRRRQSVAGMILLATGTVYLVGFLFLVASGAGTRSAQANSGVAFHLILSVIMLASGGYVHGRSRVPERPARPETSISTETRDGTGP